MTDYEAGYVDGSTHYELEHCPACKNVADLQAALDENAKLRALVSDMWREFPKTDCGWDTSANLCTEYDECHGECGFWYRMRELGVEAEG